MPRIIDLTITPDDLAHADDPAYLDEETATHCPIALALTRQGYTDVAVESEFDVVYRDRANNQWHMHLDPRGKALMDAYDTGLPVYPCTIGMFSPYDLR